MRVFVSFFLIAITAEEIDTQMSRFHIETHGTSNNRSSFDTNEPANNAPTTIIPQLNNGTSIATHEKDVFWEVLQFMSNSIIFVFGVSGNALIALTIVQNKSMHSLQHYFVFSLALTDFVTLILILPLNLMNKYVSWPFGEFACRYFLPIGDVVPAVSILTLVSVSFDRYRAIVYALSRPPSFRIGVFYIVALWIACYLILGFPLTFAFVVGPGFWVKEMCYTKFPSRTFERTYLTLRTVFFYIIPSIIIFLCYIRVNEVLGSNLKFLERSISGVGQVQRLKRQRHVMKMFFAIFFTFAICFLPINLCTLLYIYSKDFATWGYIGETFQLTTVFGFSNSVCNPVILYYLSRAYRESFQRYLPFLKSFCHGKCSLQEKESTFDEDVQTYDDEQRKRFGLFAGRRNTKESHVSLHTLSPSTCHQPLNAEALYANEVCVDAILNREDENIIENTLFVNNGYDGSTSFIVK